MNHRLEKENVVDMYLDYKTWRDMDDMVFSWTRESFLAKENPLEHEKVAFYAALNKNAGINQFCKWIEEGMTIAKMDKLLAGLRADLTPDRENYLAGIEFIQSCYEMDQIEKRNKKLQRMALAAS